MKNVPFAGERGLRELWTSEVHTRTCTRTRTRTRTQVHRRVVQSRSKYIEEVELAGRVLQFGVSKSRVLFSCSIYRSLECLQYYRALYKPVAYINRVELCWSVLEYSQDKVYVELSFYTKQLQKQNFIL